MHLGRGASCIFAPKRGVSTPPKSRHAPQTPQTLPKLGGLVQLVQLLPRNPTNHPGGALGGDADQETGPSIQNGDSCPSQWPPCARNTPEVHPIRESNSAHVSDLLETSNAHGRCPSRRLGGGGDIFLDVFSLFERPARAPQCTDPPQFSSACALQWVLSNHLANSSGECTARRWEADPKKT